MTAEPTHAHIDGWGQKRTKTVSWHDPAPATAIGLSMAGIDYLNAVIDGTLSPPPIAGLLAFTMTSADPDAWCSPARPTNPHTTRSAPYTADSCARCSIL